MPSVQNSRVSSSKSFTVYVDNPDTHQRSGRRSQESICQTPPATEKRKGLSERAINPEDTENREMKSRKRSTSKSKPKSKHADVQYVERTVSAQAASRWKPLAKVTKQFVLDTIDDAIVNVLNETHTDDYEDVQDTLNVLRQRIVGSLSAVTAPPTRVSSHYRQLEDHRHTLELSVAETTKQVELLEEEIGEHERLTEDKEKMLKELKATSDKTVDRRQRKVHPIIQNNNQLALGLPQWKGTRAGSKEVKASSKSSINPHYDQCMELRKKWQAEGSVKDIATLIGASDVTDE